MVGPQKPKPRKPGRAASCNVARLLKDRQVELEALHRVLIHRWPSLADNTRKQYRRPSSANDAKGNAVKRRRALARRRRPCAVRRRMQRAKSLRRGTLHLPSHAYMSRRFRMMRVLRGLPDGNENVHNHILHPMCSTRKRFRVLFRRAATSALLSDLSYWYIYEITDDVAVDQRLVVITGCCSSTPQSAGDDVLIGWSRDRVGIVQPVVRLKYAGRTLLVSSSELVLDSSTLISVWRRPSKEAVEIPCTTGLVALFELRAAQPLTAYPSLTTLQAFTITDTVTWILVDAQEAKSTFHLLVMSAQCTPIGCKEREELRMHHGHCNLSQSVGFNHISCMSVTNAHQRVLVRFRNGQGTHGNLGPKCIIVVRRTDRAWYFVIGAVGHVQYSLLHGCEVACGFIWDTCWFDAAVTKRSTSSEQPWVEECWCCSDDVVLHLKNVPSRHRRHSKRIWSLSSVPNVAVTLYLNDHPDACLP